MLKLKTCIKCGLTKPLEEFYIDKRNGDKRRGACKMCVKAQVRANYRGKKAYFQEYDRRRNSDPHRKEASAKRYRKLREAHPEKVKAYDAVHRAVKSGVLIKGPCEICGSKKVQAHHEDYSKPLDVIWLCSLHHHWIHS